MHYSVAYCLSFLLLAATVPVASGAGVEHGFIPREREAKGTVEDPSSNSLALRALFKLKGRKSDKCSPCEIRPELCCRNGRHCCPAPNNDCVQPGGECCEGDGTCRPGEKCCKPHGCIPKDGTCCDSGHHCKAGFRCTKKGCALDESDDGDKDDDNDDDDDSSRSAGNGKPTEYTFTAEWRYWSYVYTTFLGKVTLFSTQIETSSVVPVTATGAADAYNQYTSITRTMSFPTPAEATQTPPMPSEEDQSAMDSTTTAPDSTESPASTESPGAASLVVPPMSGNFAIIAILLGAAAVPGLLALAI